MTEPDHRRPPRRLAFGVAAAVAMTLALAGVAMLAEDPAGGGASLSGALAFVSGVEGTSELYWAESPTAAPVRLTDHPATDADPDWSPGGDRIVFVSDRTGNLEIHVLEVASGEVTQLSDQPAEDLHPAWSPDGRRIAFVSERDAGESPRDYDGNAEIYVMDADGANVRRLTDHADDDTHPAWSPDGEQIAFASNRGGSFDLYLMDADGSGLRRLTEEPGTGWEPVWSPDGRRIAYTYSPSGMVPRQIGWISIVDVVGGEVRRLTKALHGDVGPAWSGDGRWIAFTSYREGAPALFVVPPDDSLAERQLPLAGFQPAWRP